MLTSLAFINQKQITETSKISPNKLVSDQPAPREVSYPALLEEQSGPVVIKVAMLNSAKHEIYPAHKCLKCLQLLASSMINTTSERLKARNFFCRYFSFYGQLKSCAQLS